MEKIGCFLKDDKLVFRLFAPGRRKIELHLIEPEDMYLNMHKDRYGYWKYERHYDEEKRYLYKYRVNGRDEFPDPCSNHQPYGVHGPSQFIDHNLFKFKYDKPQKKEHIIMMEIHIGTFTSEGTFRSAIGRLDHIKGLGIDIIEIMPVAQFDGKRNWGYDGVYLFAPHSSYGSPNDMKEFVDECHKRDIEVILDVVYNHIGPCGNYLSEYAPYFTHRYLTPWGDAINYDDKYSYGVRDFVLQNVSYWLIDFNLDGLRLDAVHSIFDQSSVHIVRDICKKANGKGIIIAESDLNDTKVIDDQSKFGFGCDYQWTDDFHHALHSNLTDERKFYYVDFQNKEKLLKSYENGYVFTGEYSVFRKRKFGSSTKAYPSHKFIVFSQNHDQIGNRKDGDRLIILTDDNRAILAAAFTILSPFSVMLFMGEEFGEKRPFQYFVDFQDDGLRKAVYNGRRREFSNMIQGSGVPDPCDEKIFLNSKLCWQECGSKRGRWFLDKYKRLINIKKHKINILGDRGKRRNYLKDDILISEVEGCRMFFNFSSKKKIIIVRGEYDIQIKNNAYFDQKENQLVFNGYGFMMLEERQ